MPSKTDPKSQDASRHPGEGRGPVDGLDSGFRRNDVSWPGPKSVALFEEEQQYIAPGIQSIALLSKLAIERGDGCWLTDVDGNKYLDFNVGVSVSSIGYSHPKYIRAVQEQLEKVTVGSFTSEVRLKLLKLIAEITPGNLKRTQLFSGGAEAVEAAIRLARSHTKKVDVIGFTGGFHGKTAGVLPISDIDWKVHFPMAPNMYVSPYPDVYRFNGTPEQCYADAIARLKELIQTQSKGNLAAIIAEPIQGTAGNIVPPEGFIRQLRDIAHENGALYISDEMICGFGRTGRMFGCDYDSVEPDIMTVGKGIGAGFPVSGVITTDVLAQAKPWSLPSASSSSYGGNPLASAAALVTIQTILDEKLTENSARVGTVLLNALKALQAKHECIGDVRGRGLLIGFDLVTNRKTKEKMPKAVCEKFFAECLKRGLIMMGYAPRVRIHPPLVLTEKEALEGVQRIDGALEAIRSEIPR
jgi:4-aminobutyrate aminotransferase / (S)-3-amino-2-methylpropionate transaminase / 5-aminovalerate transaminase